MPRYIDAMQITYSWQYDADGMEHDGVTLQSIIDKIPTADVVEVKHGEWIGDNGNLGYDDYCCSCCEKYTETRNKIRLPAYCGFCGAKMDRRSELK